MKAIQSLSILSCLLFSVSSSAYLEKEVAPVCLDGKAQKSINNAEALYWKFNTKNQYLARAYVKGTVVKAPWIKGDHSRFIISIGDGKNDTLEIIYNMHFGSIPEMEVGDEVTVCGDYITSNADTGRYQASPAGAIIHWVHYNPGDRSMDHEHGFIVHESSTLIGFDDAPRSAWKGRVGGKDFTDSDEEQGRSRGRARDQRSRHSEECPEWKKRCA